MEETMNVQATEEISAPAEETKNTWEDTQETDFSRKTEKESQRSALVQKRVLSWLAAGQQLCPGGNLLADMRCNHQLLNMLHSGVSVQTAMKALYFDQALAEAVRRTAEQVKKSTVETIRQRGLRPMENGSGPAHLRRTDVSASTRAQREQWEKDAWMGKQVTLK